MEKKVIRLQNLAKEIGVGVNTLIDFFTKDGYSDINANTKISDEMHRKALKKFSSDIQLQKKVEQQIEKEYKETTKITEIIKEEEKTETKIEPKEEKKVVLEEKIKISGPTVLGKIDLDNNKKVKEDKIEVENKKKIEEENNLNEESVVEEIKENEIIEEIELPIIEQDGESDNFVEPKEELDDFVEQEEEINLENEEEIIEQVEEIIEETSKEIEIPKEEKKSLVTQREDVKVNGPVVLGKLDLNQVNRPTRPEKKTKEEKELERKKHAEKYKKPVKEEKSISKKDFEKNRQNHPNQNNQNNQNQNQKTNPNQNPNQNQNQNQKGKKVEKVNLNDNSKFDYKKKKKPFEKETTITSEQDIKKQLKETQKLIDQRKKSDASKYHKEKREQVKEKLEQKRKVAEKLSQQINVSEYITVKELASLIGVETTKIIEFCLDMGQPVNINFRLDVDLIKMISEEFNIEVTFVENSLEDEIEKILSDKANLINERPPIVTVMGHVDHGKTSLLDYIRKTNVVSKESGGITQHIGAYSVDVQGKIITFIDTPGHEAFTSMRARGAKITDIAIIVVAADDKIMPQTEEAIDHAKAAGVSIIFAINKIDKNNADPERIKKELAEKNMLIEQWGGKYGCVEISAKQGINIDKLLERILIEAELMELKANAETKGIATVIEAKLDKGRGFITNAIVRNGTLRVGDIIVSGPNYGRIKALFNDREEKIKEAGPSRPVVILGLNGAPEPGEPIIQMDSEREASDRAKQREEVIREIEKRARKKQTLQEISKILSMGQSATINFIVKADVKGSCDAIATQMTQLSSQEVNVNVIRAAVGEISESDVLLATASGAIIIGFNVRPSVQARNTAENKTIEIRLYSIIFDVINDVKQAISGMMAPEIKEEFVGTAEVLNTFKIDKVGSVAGCMVRDGKIIRDSKVHVIRDGIVVYTGKLNSLKRFKDDVKEVTKGMDCGLSIENFNDIKIGDFVEAFKEYEVERKI